MTIGIQKSKRNTKPTLTYIGGIEIRNAETKRAGTKNKTNGDIVCSAGGAARKRYQSENSSRITVGRLQF